SRNRSAFSLIRLIFACKVISGKQNDSREPADRVRGKGWELSNQERGHRRRLVRELPRKRQVGAFERLLGLLHEAAGGPELRPAVLVEGCVVDPQEVAIGAVEQGTDRGLGLRLHPWPGLERQRGRAG